MLGRHEEKSDGGNVFEAERRARTETGGSGFGAFKE